ncbi:hypothetical protein MJO28_005392 [Puccinia striiformis f. sp. tritici]|uniref:Uncharacterized protein n=1 Tax=Puccinia striiformis f. sp. tritici TaxID=168172 RepID=A0ACC0EJX2_9BASI|nr:hypothetical protein MJO28_005392 [Puccinia striiformis f. sp. tritici]
MATSTRSTINPRSQGCLAHTLSMVVLFLSFQACLAGPAPEKKKIKTSIPIVNEKHLYTIPVGFGSPPQYHRLGIATGSANTYTGSIVQYKQTQSTFDLHQQLFIPYGYGNATGKLVTDTITLGESETSVKLTNTTVGNVTKLVGFEGFDGLLGLGLSSESYPRNEENIGQLLTPTGLMYDRGLLEKVMFGLSFMPTRKDQDPNGILTIGGVEPSRFVGDLTWYPCSSYRTWDWTASISYGENDLSGKAIMGAFDTSYTNTPALPRDLFDKYVLGIPGALWDDSWLSLNPSGSVNKYMLKIPSSSVAEMEDLCFTAKDVRWCLCPEAQLVPDGLITDGEPGYRYGYVSPLQTTVNQEAKFICTCGYEGNGTFLRSFRFSKLSGWTCSNRMDELYILAFSRSDKKNSSWPIAEATNVEARNPGSN